jgi:glycosyltransferase involved in cell wall biosynthesis
MRDYCLQGKERIHILCIARLHPVKALPVLLGALAHLRAQNMDVVLDIGGDGDADYVTGLKQLASSLDLDGAVIWHGHVDDAQKRELYIKADCFALLSYHENFGLAAAEALAAGVAVVVSDQVGLAPDVLAYNAGKVVPAGNVMAAAEAIQSLLGKDIVQLYRIRARQLAEERYGEAFFAAGLDSLYRRVLAVNASIGCVTVAS